MARSVRGSGAAVGYLASVRNVVLHVARLDDLTDELVAAAERVTGDARTVLYEFSVWSAQRPLLEGRASIVMDVRFGAVIADPETLP
jgi:predicted hotdog family 3-hydroxylacyl-ACP dehydratase